VIRLTKACTAGARVMDPSNERWSCPRAGCEREEPLDKNPGDSFKIRARTPAFARASSCPSLSRSSRDEKAYISLLAADFFLTPPPPLYFRLMSPAPAFHPPPPAKETLRAGRDHPCTSSRRAPGTFRPSLRTIPSCSPPARMMPARGRRAGVLLKMSPRTP
jgi:hypothetical protein